VDRPTFSLALRHAIAGALAEFRRHAPDESPYAFAIIMGQSGDYLGYAVATEEGLHRVAEKYALAGYRYRGPEWDDSNDRDRLAEWLRWANPDDGWCYGDFADNYGISGGLAHLVQSGAFGEDAEGLEEFCTEVLTALRSDPIWLEIAAGVRIVVGVTSGEDPRNFLRTATRANDYHVVLQLWAEFGRGEELSSRIAPPRSGTV
jgi:hypothetical protein